MIQDEYRDFNAKILYQFSYGIVPMVIAGIGCIGNILVLLVYTRKKFAKNSLKSYFISLALTDSLTLVSSLKIFIAYYLGIEVELSSHLLCQMSEYCDFILPSVSAWTLVVISFDRMIKIIYTKRMQFMNKLTFQVTTLLLIVLCNMLIYIPSLLFRHLTDKEIRADDARLESHQLGYLKLFDYHMVRAENVSSNETGLDNSASSTNASKRTCQYRLSVLTSNWIHMINSSLLPFLFMFTFSSLTICYIFKSRRKLKSSKCFLRATILPAAVNQQPFTISSLVASVSQTNHQAAQISIKYKSSFSRDMNFVFNSISLNFIFLFLTLPILVLNVISTQYRTMEFNTYVATVSINVFYFNYASLFFINILSNSIFRCECALMLRIKREARPNVSINNRSSI
jgi:hypothetical protein